MKINIKHLYQFFLTAKEGSVKQAAKILNVTEPTVSKQIRDFEDFVGVNLFDRSSRRLSMTREGEAVAERSEKIFQLVTELEYFLAQNTDSMSNSLVVGAMPILNHEIDGFLRAHRRDSSESLEFVQADLGSLLRWLEDQKIQLVLADYPYVGDSEKFATFELPRRSKFVAVVSKRSKEADMPFPQILEKLPLVALSGQYRMQKNLDFYLKNQDIHPKNILRFQCPYLARKAALYGYGVAVLPEFLVRDDLQNRALRKAADVDFLSLECWIIALSARVNESMIRCAINALLSEPKTEVV